MSAYLTLRQRAMTRRFWAYALPSILAMLVSGAYYLIDGIFVGHYVGAAGLAGINLVYPVIMVLIGLAAMISMGRPPPSPSSKGRKTTSWPVRRWSTPSGCWPVSG